MDRYRFPFVFGMEKEAIRDAFFVRLWFLFGARPVDIGCHRIGGDFVARLLVLQNTSPADHSAQ